MVRDNDDDDDDNSDLLPHGCVTMQQCSLPPVYTKVTGGSSYIHVSIDQGWDVGL